ncbi:MAG: 23S rRNA (adenine(2503)-C(2))-methyltransferase RlmN [Spirochaetales bacterium]|nr:23S rRNA (adenine(2503)-C(2))-methyltransferase RlmN [Spirochaetales bacterium]
MNKIILSNLLPQEINEQLELNQSFRGKQIFKWISSGVKDFSLMTNLSKELRENLEQKAQIRSANVSNVLKDSDGTIKLQITLSDGNCVETVLLTDREDRKTACVSCQAGCAMKCAFCQTGTLGLSRNLTAGEIVEQFLNLEEIAGTLDNIVFMGMGEPMQNLENIRKAIQILCNKDGRALSSKRITLSTCGIVKGIYNLADNGPNIRLAVSLTTADEELRKELMPVAKSEENNLEKLRESIKYYTEKTGKRVTLEAALLHNKNTSKESAQNMIIFARDLDVNINLIPWNPVSTLPFTEPSRNEIDQFTKQLQNAGLNVTLRTKRGREIGGACGQLGKTLNT